MSATADAEIQRRFRQLECSSAVAIARHSVDDRLADDVRLQFRQLHDLLAEQPLSRPVAEAWRHFYALTARLHELRNERARKARLPVYAYNGHQHAARLWIDETARRGARGPLVHFDSHDDMRELDNSTAILAAARKLRSGGGDRDQALLDLRGLITDHATPVSAGVLARVTDNVIWAAPSWSQTLPFSSRPLLYADISTPRGKSFSLLHDRAADPERVLPAAGVQPWMSTDALTPAQRRGMTNKRPFQLSIVHTYPVRRNNTLAQLTRLIPKGAFILDIDLDYFLTVDCHSGFSRKLPDHNDRMAKIAQYEHRLNIAAQLLDTRIDELTGLLRGLRDRGRVPSMVTLADSTYRPFSPFPAGHGYWEYTPIEFAAHAHWRVRRALAQVYAKHGIDAGV